MIPEPQRLLRLLLRVAPLLGWRHRVSDKDANHQIVLLGFLRVEGEDPTAQLPLHMRDMPGLWQAATEASDFAHPLVALPLARPRPGTIVIRPYVR